MLASITKLFKRSGGKAASTPAPAAKPARVSRGATPSARSVQPGGQSAAEMDSGEQLGVAFTSLIKTVPANLHGKRGSPEPVTGKFFIARELVLEQLAKGSVRVKFGEIRRAAPAGLFMSSGAEDERMIDLPLGELLPQLKPDELPRRSQHRVEIPDDISNLFGSNQGLSSVRVAQEEVAPTTARKAAATPAKPAETPEVRPRKAVPEMAESQTAAPAAGARMAAAVQAKIPAAPGMAAAVAAPAAAKPSTLPAAPAPAPASASALAPAPKGEGKMISIGLTELAAKWPDQVQREIKSSSLINAVCELPAAELTKAMKQGKVELPWKTIRSWLNPAVSGPSALGEMVLQLPLEILAPIFLNQNPGGPQRKIEVSSEIPDIFNRTTPTPLPTPPPAPPPGRSKSDTTVRIRPDTAFRTRPEPPPAPAAPAAESNTAFRARSDTSYRTRTDTAFRSKPLEPATGPVPISLSLLAATWPPTLVKEFDTAFLAQAKLEIPVEALEPGMRSGKVDFLWKQLCGWLVPSAPPAVIAAHADTRIELPLSIVAPLFLQRKPDLSQQKRSDIQVDVPDVFQPAPVSISGAEQPQEAPLLLATDSSAMPGNTEIRRRIRDLADLFGQPDKRNWTPNEIVQKTTALPGVAGALIALQDGLLVASCMPPEWRTETIAAFLPQIFGRMHQYTKELKMGELQSVTFAVEKGALLIFAAGIIYFAVLSKPETSLPLHELTLIARELSRHTK